MSKPVARDLVMHVTVGMEAQLSRIERMVHQIGSADEIKRRVPPLLRDVQKQLHELRSEMGQGSAPL